MNTSLKKSCWVFSAFSIVFTCSFSQRAKDTVFREQYQLNFSYSVWANERMSEWANEIEQHVSKQTKQIIISSWYIFNENQKMWTPFVWNETNVVQEAIVYELWIGLFDREIKATSSSDKSCWAVPFGAYRFQTSHLIFEIKFLLEYFHWFHLDRITRMLLKTSFSCNFQTFCVVSQLRATYGS